MELAASIKGSCPVTLTALGATVIVAPLIGFVEISEFAFATGAQTNSAITEMLSTRIIFTFAPFSPL